MLTIGLNSDTFNIMSNLSSSLPSKLLIKRPCVTVANLKQSLLLYEDILGFKLTYTSKASSQSYLYQVFNLPSQAEITFASLDGQHEPRILALTEVKGIKLSAPSLAYSCALVIEVSNLEAKIEQIKQLNLAVKPANLFTTENNFSFLEQAILDFDGHPLVLYEQL